MWKHTDEMYFQRGDRKVRRLMVRHVANEIVLQVSHICMSTIGILDVHVSGEGPRNDLMQHTSVCFTGTAALAVLEGLSTAIASGRPAVPGSVYTVSAVVWQPLGVPRSFSVHYSPTSLNSRSIPSN